MRSLSSRPAQDLSHSRTRRLVRGLLVVALACALLLVGASASLAASAAPAQGRRGMVVSSSSHAAEAGAQMLRAGGNAVDAAVATAFAVAVTQPFSAGLGGGAFALIRVPGGEVFALDAREVAPAAATRDMYVKEGVPERASLFGPLAVAVPGFTQGMALAQRKFGKLELAQVLAPAIELAEEGFEIGAYHARMVNRASRFLPGERFPETARIQFTPLRRDGGASPGMRLVQEDLAKTLRAIATGGPEVLASGEIAHKIAAEIERRGGIVTAKDLAAFRPKMREPVRGRYRGLAVYSFPPPSSGGAVLVQALNILEGFDLGSHGAGSSQTIHLVTEAMKLGFADRAAYMGDADFVDVPVEKLTSREYAERQRSRMNRNRATKLEGPGLPANDSGTAHLSATDAEGFAVALTMTINTPFGSGITVPGTGIILNNEMDDFAVAPDTPNAYGLVDTTGANAIAPGKRPLSSMTPTILTKGGQTFMVTGSPGGPRIISTTLETVLSVVDFGMDVQAAVSVPRFHHQWIPDKLRLEPEFAPDVVEALRKRGHDVDVQSRHWSAAEAIVVDPETGIHFGGTDPRTQGAAIGY